MEFTFPSNKRVELRNPPIRINCTSFNSTSSSLESGVWESIPTNIVVNLIIFLVLMFIFAILREFALRAKYDRHLNCLQFIYGDRGQAHSAPSKPAKSWVHRSKLSEHFNGTSFEEPIESEAPTERASEATASPASPSRKPAGKGQDEVKKKEDSKQDEKKRDPEEGENKQREIWTEGTELKFKQEADRQRTFFSDRIGGGESDQPPELRTKLLRATCTFIKRVWLIIRISEEEMLKNRGFDAVQYLSFQRHIIYFLLLLTSICLFIILPINIEGNLKSPNEAYARTTINNIDPSSNLLWAHATTAWMLFPVGIYFMYRFSTTIGPQFPQFAYRTLFICHIPKEFVQKEYLIQWFQKRFPDVSIEAIQQVYDTKKLKNLLKSYSSLLSQINYCEDHKRFYGVDFRIRPYPLGNAIGIFCPFCPQKDGLTYYQEKALQVEEQLKIHLQKTVESPIGSVFITFKTSKMAKKVFQKLSKSRQPKLCYPFAKLWSWLMRKWRKGDIEIFKWQVSFAPNPEDINWDEMSSGLGMICIRRILSNLLLVGVFLFITTPPMVLVIFHFVISSEAWEEAIDYLSTFVLILAAQILPAIVILVSSHIPYKTISEKNHSIMWKTFIFLVLMILILPSLGFNTAAEIITSVATASNETQNLFNWKCLFPVDDGAFFINYVLQTALIGHALDLLRIPEVLKYFYYIIFANYSAAEFGAAQQSTRFEFYFGTRYAQFLFIFCMVVSYSITCPLIAPCGLLYMCLRYVIDKYCVYSVYTPTKINNQIHSTAILFFHIAITMMQFQVLTHFYLTTGYSDLTGMTMIGVIISILFFVLHIVFNCFGNFESIFYSTILRISKLEKIEFCACHYVPPILLELDEDVEQGNP